MPRVLLLVVFALLWSGCTTQAGNLLQDPSFEADSPAWFWFEDHEDWAPFHFDANTSVSGNRSLSTPIDVGRNGPPTLVVGGIQEVDSDAMGGRLPERLSLHWRTDQWDTTVDKTYVQVVVSLFPQDDATTPICPGLRPANPCQLAYILAGVEDPPLPIANRLYVFAGPAEPTLGQWIPHDLSLAEHFRQAWGSAPGAFSHMWVYFEARYDGPSRATQAGPVRLDVQWDDVYLGD